MIRLGTLTIASLFALSLGVDLYIVIGHRFGAATG